MKGSEYVNALEREVQRLQKDIIDRENNYAQERDRALAAEMLLCLGSFLLGYAVAVWVGV